MTSWPRWLTDEKSGKAARDRKPKEHEKSTAKALGGRVQPGSGSKDGHKGDVRDIETFAVDFVGECKRTEKKSLRLEAAWLNKITTEAGFDKEPALVIRFDEKVLKEIATRDQIVADGDWVAVPRRVFRRMLSALREKEQWD